MESPRIEPGMCDSTPKMDRSQNHEIAFANRLSRKIEEA